MKGGSFDDLFSIPGGNILILGVGTVGGRVAASGALDDACAEAFERAAWYAVHSDPAELLATGLEKKLRVTLARGPFAARSAAGSIAAHREELAAACAGKSAALAVGVLGEEVVTAALPSLVRELRENGLPVCVVVTGPLRSETPAQADDTKAALEQLATEAEMVIWFRTEGLVSVSLEGSATVLYAQVKSRLLAATQALIGALAGDSSGGMSLPALRESLPGAGPISAGLGVMAGRHAVRRALESARAGAAGAGAAASVGAVLLTNGELTVAEARAARQYLEQEWSVRSAPVVAVATRTTLAGEAVCVVLVRHAGHVASMSKPCVQV